MTKPVYDPTIPAKQVWKYLYNKPWPRGLKVKWCSRMKNLGLTTFDNYRPLEIKLSWKGFVKEPLAEGLHSRDGEGGVVVVLLHELAHVAAMLEDHGPAFELLFGASMKRFSLRN